MDEILNWIIQNKGWIFSGFGIAIPLAMVTLIYSKNNSNKQIQKSGKNSTNIQIGGNISINKNNQGENIKD